MPRIVALRMLPSEAGKWWGTVSASPEHSKMLMDLGALFICHGADIVFVKQAWENVQKRYTELGFAFENRLADIGARLGDATKRYVTPSRREAVMQVSRRSFLASSAIAGISTFSLAPRMLHGDTAAGLGLRQRSSASRLDYSTAGSCWVHPRRHRAWTPGAMLPRAS